MARTVSPTSVSQAADARMATAAGDQHTNYLSPSSYPRPEDFDSSNQRYVGIGASLSRDPFAIGMCSRQSAEAADSKRAT